MPAPEVPTDAPTPGHGGKRPGAGRKPRSEVHSSYYELLTQARAKHEAYRAQLAELDYKQRMGQLLPADEVAREWSEQVRIARDRLLALPPRLAPTVLRLGDLREVEDAIRDAIYAVLEELAGT